MKMKCAKCGHKGLELGLVERTVNVGELSYTAEVPAKVCPNCGAYRLGLDTLRQFGAMVAVDLAREGVSSPEAFKYMRKRLRLPAKELAALLDVSPETVSRWEHGKYPVDPRAVKLLGVMVLASVGERPGLDYLRSLLGEREPREPARRLPTLAATA
jgi:DNA-binding transcriptional regulator YiaG